MARVKSSGLTAKRLLFFFGLLLVAVGLLFSVRIDMLVCVFLLFISFLFLIQNRKNPLILLLAFILLYFNTSVVFGYYIFPENRLQFLATSFDPAVLTISICCLFLFNLTLYCFMPGYLKKTAPKFKKNDSLFLAMFAAALLFTIAPLIRASGFINRFFEYYIVVFAFLCYFSGNKKANKRAVLILYAVYCLVSFLVARRDNYSTGRITILQCGALVFTYLYYKHISIKNLFLAGGAALTALTLVAAFRYGPGINIAGVIKSLFRSLLFNDTAIFAYGTSTTFIAYAKTYSSFSLAATSFFQFVLSIFIGSGSERVALSQVNVLTREYFYHYFGGYLPFYFFFWFGWPGVLFIGLLLAKILKRLNRSQSDYAFILTVVLLAISFRWYLYNPIAIFRMTLFVSSIAYFVLSLADKLLKPHKRMVAPAPLILNRSLR